MRRIMILTVCFFVSQVILFHPRLFAEVKIPTKKLEPVYSWTTEGTIEYVEFYPEIYRGKFPKVKKIVYSDPPSDEGSTFHFIEYDIMGKEVLSFKRELTRITVSPKAKYFWGFNNRERMIDCFNDKNDLLWSKESILKLSNQIDIGTYRTFVTDNGTFIEAYKEYYPCQFLTEMGPNGPHYKMGGYGPHYRLKIVVHSQDNKKVKTFQFPHSYGWRIKYSTLQLSDDQKYFFIDNVVFISNKETSMQLVVLDLERLKISVRELCRIPKKEDEFPSSGDFFPDYYNTYHNKIYGIFGSLDDRCKNNINLIDVGEFIKENMTNTMFFSVSKQDYFLDVNERIEIISINRNKRVLNYKLPSSRWNEMTFGINLDLQGKTLLCTSSWIERKGNYLGNVYRIRFKDILSQKSYRLDGKFQLYSQDRIVFFLKTIVVDRFLIVCHTMGYIIFDLEETEQ